MTIITRIFYYLYRLFNAIRFLGILNSLKIFYFSKLFKSKLMKISLFNNNFYFRPKVDNGSYSRLTKSQYIVKSTLNQPMEFVIDAGANIGSQAIRFVNLNPQIKKIICVEPDIENYKLCKENLKNYKAVVYNNALASSSNQNLLVQKTVNSEMSEIINGGDKDLIKTNNSHTIKTISINDIIKKENINRIDLMKLDINGYENEVFSKNLEWLNITNCMAFNNADINDSTSKMIRLYEQAVGKIKIYNIDQMIFLIRHDINWLPTKGFMNSKRIGYFESDERF